MKQKTATFFDLTRTRLHDVEECIRASPDEHHPGLEAAIDHLLTSGGKRIRPIAVILTGGMLNANIDQTVTHAAAIELLHTATLVHDDLVDGSLMRRGFPTLNARIGPEATVLTGDYIFARAAHLAAETQSIRLMEAFSHTLMIIVKGEVTQLFDPPSKDLRQGYLERTYAKTASLFEIATGGVPILNENDRETIQAMKNFGRNIGLAFQIVDDILDFIGDPTLVGKPVANDLRQGLITLPTLCYLESRPDQLSVIDKLRNQSGDEAVITELIHEIRDSEAIEMARGEAEEFVIAAEASLDRMPPVQEREALFELARYVLNRTI